MVVYIYYITAAGNSISSQMGGSYQGDRYGTQKAGGYGPSITCTITPAASSQPGGPPCWAITLAFGLTGPHCPFKRVSGPFCRLPFVSIGENFPVIRAGGNSQRAGHYYGGKMIWLAAHVEQRFA